MKNCILFSVIFLGFVCAGCSKETSADSLFVPKPTASPKIVRAESKVIDEKSNSAKITESVLNTDENYRKVYFFDKDNGWLIGKAENLYKTEDGGKNWTKVPIQVEKDAFFADVIFVNQSFGWITIKRVGNVNKNDTKSWLMKTSDSGKTWQTILAEDFTGIYDIYFLDENNGWLIGETSNPKNVYDSTKFLRKTNDGGKTWTEIGANLFEKNGFQDARQMITGLIAETPERFKVSMFSSKLFETNDGGKTWNQFGPQFDFPPQTTLSNFGKLGNSNRLRMARGTWSIEGIYSYIATENNNTWTIRWTDEPACIYDIIFLSENDLIAVGRLSVSPYKKNYQEDGVILYSSDAGENLKIIYRNKLISEINSISKIAENQFMAVGNKGLIVKVELTK